MSRVGKKGINMGTSQNRDEFLAFILGLALGIFISIVADRLQDPTVAEQSIVDLDYAYYSPKTKEFKWFTRQELVERFSNRNEEADK